MKHEAKFSVIFSSKGIAADQISTFEEIVTRNGLEIELPLKMDLDGNYVISTGLTLRDAQLLRRKVAGYGFNPEVTSDASEESKIGNTTVVELGEHSPFDNLDLGANSWESMEMPSSLDLGLSDDNMSLSVNEGYKGEHWLDPELEEREQASEGKTMSLSVDDILRAAENNGDDLLSMMASPSLDASSMMRDKLADEDKKSSRLKLEGLDFLSSSEHDKNPNKVEADNGVGLDDILSQISEKSGETKKIVEDAKFEISDVPFAQTEGQTCALPVADVLRFVEIAENEEQCEELDKNQNVEKNEENHVVESSNEAPKDLNKTCAISAEDAKRAFEALSSGEHDVESSNEAPKDLNKTCAISAEDAKRAFEALSSEALSSDEHGVESSNAAPKDLDKTCAISAEDAKHAFEALNEVSADHSVKPEVMPNEEAKQAIVQNEQSKDASVPSEVVVQEAEKTSKRVGSKLCLAAMLILLILVCIYAFGSPIDVLNPLLMPVY